MEAEIHFGTDGWRARIAEDYTFDNVRRCAQGFASYLAEKGGTDVVVGYDQRFQSEFFAAAAAEVMAANGFHVWLTDAATPTPVISYSAFERKAAGAINITSSHNPHWDNGFKVRDETGGAVPPDGLKKIEARIPPIAQAKRVPLEEAKEAGKVTVWDPKPVYVGHIGKLVDIEAIKDAGFTVLVEPMWGNGIGWFPMLLRGGKTRVTEIHNQRHPLFPEMLRPEPIPPNVDVALKKSVELGADVCVITDGDADRMGIGDENGVFLNQLQVYGLLAYYFLEVRRERGAIIKTVSTTTMLDRLGEIYGVPVYQTGVGMKHVIPKYHETDGLIGGEESGGYVFRGNVPERDGILGNLLFLDMMVRTGKTPSQLLQALFDKLGAAYYYSRVDTRFPAERHSEIRQRIAAARPGELAGFQVTEIVTIDGHKFMLEDGGWLLIRFSGTEPIIRVYCETTDESKVEPLLDAGLHLAGLA
jgi:phosphomannomutase